MTMLRWLGNAAEENNFKNISCPRDVRALLRHQRPEIAGVWKCVCVRPSVLYLYFMGCHKHFFVFCVLFPSFCLWLIWFYHISFNYSLIDFHINVIYCKCKSPNKLNLNFDVLFPFALCLNHLINVTC